MSEQKPSEIRAEVYDYIHSLGFNITHEQREGLSKILKKFSSQTQQGIPEQISQETSEPKLCSSCQLSIVDDMIFEPGDEEWDDKESS